MRCPSIGGGGRPQETRPGEAPWSRLSREKNVEALLQMMGLARSRTDLGMDIFVPGTDELVLDSRSQISLRVALRL